MPTTLLRPGEDGWIVAECPLLPGCISQGRTRDEALENIREGAPPGSWMGTWSPSQYGSNLYNTPGAYAVWVK